MPKPSRSAPAAMEQNPNIPPLRMDVVDGIERYPRTGINVIVAGGGIGGLMAALECWRKGHDVRVLERSPEFSTFGDFFLIEPSGLPTIENYPEMFKEYEQMRNDAPAMVTRHDGTILKKTEPEWQLPGAPKHAGGDFKISLYNTRASFGKMLYDQCLRLGIMFEFDRRVIRYGEDETAGDATVETESGHIFTADVVIAADGIGTKSNQLVHGSDVKAMPTGFSILRGAYPRSIIKEGTEAATLLPKDGERPVYKPYVGPDMHCLVFVTKDTIGIALTHPDIEGVEDPAWHHYVTPEYVVEKLRGVEGFDPALISIFEQIPTKIVDWKLTCRDPQPVWTSHGGRIVQLGDACHSFLPTSANGATQAMEDAVSLAECLRLGGRDRVQWSTKVHERLRFKRTSLIQQMGFAIRNMLHHVDTNGKVPSVDPSKLDLRHGKWIWAHNSEKYASEKYALAYAHLRTGAPFEDTNLPPGCVYRPWSIDEELEREKKGEPSLVRETGDWSVS